MFIAPLLWIVLAQVPTVPLTGAVVGPVGELVIGAELILVGLPSYDPPIVARGKSGEGGRFSLDRPTALAGDHDPQRAPILWVVKPGFRASATRFPDALPKSEEPVRIVLQPPGKAEVRVLGPDGEPLRGVKVLPERLKAHYTNVPDVVADLAAATTGPDGLAIVDAVSAEELTYVDVHSREFGIQGRPIVPNPGKPAIISLRPVSSLMVRLSAQDPRYVRGWKIRAWTRVGEDPNSEPQTTGYMETTTADNGRFTLAPIAIGGLQLELKPPGDLPFVADVPGSLAVRAGRADSVDIPLKSTVAVTGHFLERGTGKPVPGITAMLIYLGNRNGHETTKTDERGRYTFKSLPGLVRVGHFAFPPTHVQAPGQGWEDFTVPEPPKVIELATREALPAAPPLRGQVIDEAGRTVPRASIQATWMLTGAKGSSSGSVSAKSGDNGDFVLEGLAPDSTVSVTGRRLDRQSKSPLIFHAGDAGPVTVAIDPMPVLAVAGRVLGPGGTPLGEIPVKVQFRIPRNNFQGFPEQAYFEDNPEIKTLADGSFKTPKVLERKPSEFRVEVNTDGFLPARTAWVSVSEGDLLTLPDLNLKRSKTARNVSGRVIDRDGKPVPGALISQAGDGPSWTSATAEADGRFRLRGVVGDKASVFAEAPGFRFGGSISVDGAEPVEIHLARTTEPPIVHLKALPSPVPRAEERALARELLDPLLPLARTGSLGSGSSSVISALARVDPVRVLDMIENRAIDPSALIQVVLGQFEDDPALAIATIDETLDPGSRAAGWLALEDFRPAPERTRRENLLERALAGARQAARGELKIKLLGQVADRWLDLGSIERARPILLEGQGILATWPRDNWFFDAEAFADTLAVIDLPAATAIFERRGWKNVSPTDAGTLNNHNGQAAVRLAGIDPAQVEQMIAPPSASFFNRPSIVLMAARKMAKADLARARRVLETIDDQSSFGPTVSPALIPFGLGAIADELAETNPIQARALLDEAFAGLRKIAVDGCQNQVQDPVANLMAELLPVVERLDRERLAERTWLVVASRSPSSQEPKAQELERTFALAMLVARYDRTIADVIAAAALERLPELLVESVAPDGNVAPPIFQCLTAYDARAINPLLRALPDLARQPPRQNMNWTVGSIETQLRLGAAEILGFPDAARPREARRRGNVTFAYGLGD
jgi:hypothetical protein